MKRIILACAGLLGIVSPSFAVVNTWTGGAGDGLWGSAGNWDQGHVPIANVEDVTIGNGYGTINLGGVTRLVEGRTVILGNVTLTNGDFQTLHTTTITANNTKFGASTTGTGLYNPSGSGTGIITFNNVTYNRDLYWTARENNTVSINGGSFNNVIAPLVAEGYNGNGTIKITGGSHSIGFFAINPNSYDFLAATVTVTSASLGIGSQTIYGGVGTGPVPAVLNVNSSTLFINSGLGGWTFGTNAYFNSSYGTIAPRGNFVNQMTNQNQWSGYILWSPRTYTTTKTFEVSGVDYGANTLIDTAAGANYSIARLQLGDTGGGGDSHLELMNASDNNLSIAGTEALYLDTLDMVNDGSIDLKGLNLYYKSLVTHGFTLTITDSVGGGNFLQAIPEPTSLTAVALAGLVAWTFRRRN